MNGTDCLEGGIDIASLPELAEAIERTGIDAIEVSGGMWDCLVRSEQELGFRPVPAPESHTRITEPAMQSYFREYAESLDLEIPVILVGGNRDIERLEEIVLRGKVDFIAMSRPLIREPDLPNRWREGRGSSKSDCISCNSCLYEMLVHPGKADPGPVLCLFDREKSKVKQAQKWLSSWVRENVQSSDAC
jgi:2,4-dienoyl-CoA reductase-like NADH-dependent reductase (Old Yellow Enzyme family)